MAEVMEGVLWLACLTPSFLLLAREAPLGWEPISQSSRAPAFPLLLWVSHRPRRANRNLCMRLDELHLNT